MKKILFALFILVGFILSTKAQTAGVTTEDIRFESAGVTLAGTIYEPAEPYAAVVLVHGSDQTPRMSEFASLLAENGITVFTYDKRGVGESGGVYVGPEVRTINVDRDNLALLAEDAGAAVDVLHKRNKEMSIGLVGFSQAGWIIPIAATKNPQVNFMVFFSGAIISVIDQLIFQNLTKGQADFWDFHTDAEIRTYLKEMRKRIPDEPDLHRLIGFEDTDPRDALGTLSIPGLWLFGLQDIQMPVGLSIDYLNALKMQGKSYEYCLFPASGHFLAASAFADPTAIVVQWIKNRAH